MGKFLLCLISLAASALAQSHSGCLVVIRVVSVSGEPQPYTVTSFRNPDTNTDYSSGFNGLQGTVPCSVRLHDFEVDRSDATARTRGLQAIRGRLAPSVPEVRRTVSTDPQWSNSPTLEVTGSKPPAGYVWHGKIVMEKYEPLWVQFRSAIPSNLDQAKIEAEIDNDGSFRAYGLFFQGPYIFYVMDRQGRIRYLASVRSERSLPQEPLTITISADPVTVVQR